MFRLRKFNPFPPGGFPYPPFPGDLDIFEQAKRVSSYRVKNKLPRAGLSDCVDDIDHYTCNRLGNNKRFCVDATLKPRKTPAVAKKGCKTCGHRK